METAFQYWQLVRLTSSGQSHIQILPQVKTWIEESFTDALRDPKYTDKQFQDLLFSIYKDKSSYSALAQLSLRCYVSHEIRSTCIQLARQFGDYYQFNAEDLFRFVLDDDGQHYQEYRPFSLHILETYAPNRNRLDAWARFLTRNHSDLNQALIERGLYRVSDWAILNDTQIGQLQRILREYYVCSEEEIILASRLLERYHQVYRRDRLIQAQQDGRRRRSQLPTDEQLHQIDSLRPAHVVLTQLRDLALQIRKYRIHVRAGNTLIQKEDTIDWEEISVRESARITDTVENYYFAESDFAETIRQSYADSIEEACQKVLKRRVIKLSRRKTGRERAEHFLKALYLFYYQGETLRDIASEVGLSNQVQVSRLLSLKSLRLDIRLEIVNCLKVQLLDFARVSRTAEELKELENRLGNYLDEYLAEISPTTRSEYISQKLERPFYYQGLATAICKEIYEIYVKGAITNELIQIYRGLINNSDLPNLDRQVFRIPQDFIEERLRKTKRVLSINTFQDSEEIESQSPSEQEKLIYTVFLFSRKETLSIGEELEVLVGLDSSINNSSRDSVYLLEVPRAQTLESELNILMTAPGFSLKSHEAASFPLDLGLAEPPKHEQLASFRLIALHPGTSRITIELYRGDTFETILEKKVKVVDPEEAAFFESKANIETRPVPRPDLVLQIQPRWNEVSSCCIFHYCLENFRGSSLLPRRITYQSQVLSYICLEQIYAYVEAALTGVFDSLPADVYSHLVSLGQYLCQHLLPTELQADLLNLSWHQAQTLLICGSQDVQFPWTLLHDGDVFLGERFIIGQLPWDLKATHPHEFPVGAINIVHYANFEQPATWATLLEPLGAPPPFMLTGGILGDLNSTEAMRGLHLLRLGQSDADASHQDAPIPLNEATEEQSLDQKVRPIKLNLRRNRPLVSLGYLRNSEPELTDLQQTWASTFLRAGCSAFVGPLWAVNSTTEAAFISSFYHALWTGDSLGGAFHTARRMARAANPESMDWLAYCLFGDPMARPYRPVPGQGYAVVEPVGQDIADPITPGSTVRFRVSLRRTPPVWHDERVIEVAEDLSFNDLQAHIAVADLQVTPTASIELRPTPSGNYLGWFNLTVPANVSAESALVQVYFADGMQTIHTLSFPLTFQSAGGDA